MKDIPSDTPLLTGKLHISFPHFEILDEAVLGKHSK
jgi:hypothetical protein